MNLYEIFKHLPQKFRRLLSFVPHFYLSNLVPQPPAHQVSAKLCDNILVRFVFFFEVSLPSNFILVSRIQHSGLIVTHIVKSSPY